MSSKGQVPVIFEALLVVLPMVVLGFLALTIYCYLTNKRQIMRFGKLNNTKDRIWRRFQMATRELYPSLDEQEKRDLVETYKNTVKNAEMFKDDSVIIDTQEDSKIITTQRKSVRFDLEPHILN